MNRQYIGARYVPKFYEYNGGAWQANVPYEALTIVTYLGNSYTSKIPVPSTIGNPADNTDYWVLTGNYNAQVEEYREEVAEIKNEISLINNRKFLFIGDSYEGTSKWGKYLAEYLGENNTFSYISTNVRVNETGSVYISAKGGTGFTNNGGGPNVNDNGFLILLTEAFNNLGSEIADSITDIAVIGGVNDAFWDIYDTEVNTNMGNFKNYADLHFKNAKLWLGFIGRIRGTNPSNITFQNLLYAYYNYSATPLFTYMHGIETTLYANNNLLDTDNLHPTETGGRVIGKNCAQLLKGGICVNVWDGSSSSTQLTVENGTSTSGIHFIPRMLDGQNKLIEIPTFDWKPTNSTIAGEFSLKIASHNLFYANKSFCFPVKAVALITDVGIININANLKVLGSDVYLEGRFPESTLSWQSYSGVLGINVYNTEVIIPAMYT